MRISLLLLALLIVLPSCGEEDQAPAASRSVLLRYKFEDQTLRYKTTVETITSNPMGGEFRMTLSSVDQHVLKAKPEGGGFAEVTRSEFDQQSNMFDKLRESGMEVPDMDEMLGSFEGVVFRMHMTERGRIEKVEGLDEAMEKMVASMDPMAAQMLKSMFSDDAMDRMMKQSQVVFPEEAVEPGAKWSHEGVIGAPMGGEGEMAIETKMLLRKIEAAGGNRVAVIGLEMTIEGKMTMMGMSMSQKGTATGEMRFDIDLGAQRNHHLVMETTSTTASLPEPMKMTMDMKSELQE